jgi:hypothetical protein
MDASPSFQLGMLDGGDNAETAVVEWYKLPTKDFNSDDENDNLIMRTVSQFSVDAAELSTHRNEGR